MTETEPKLEHTAAPDQMKARETLVDLHNYSPLGEQDYLFNLGLYARSGLLVKFLLLSDLYQRFMKVPGILCEFGTWYGQNLVLLENLRAIHEPFHKQRKIVGFDSFTGYSEGKFRGSGLYSTGPQYKDYLDRLLRCHAGMNVYGHQECPHELIEGDVCEMAPRYFRAYPQETVAFALLDIGPYAPTRAILNAIKPRLLPGSLILLDEFTLADTPGEARAWIDVMGTKGYRMERLAMYPSKCVAEIL
jgi:hypothetical protein